MKLLIAFILSFGRIALAEEPKHFCQVFLNEKRVEAAQEALSKFVLQWPFTVARIAPDVTAGTLKMFGFRDQEALRAYVRGSVGERVVVNLRADARTYKIFSDHAETAPVAWVETSLKSAELENSNPEQIMSRREVRSKELKRLSHVRVGYYDQADDEQTRRYVSVARRHNRIELTLGLETICGVGDRYTQAESDLRYRVMTPKGLFCRIPVVYLSRELVGDPGALPVKAE